MSLGCIRSLFILLDAALFAASLAAAEDPAPADPRADIATLIPHAIKILEAKEYARFIQELASPASVKNLEKQPGGIEEAAKQYESAGPGILNILKNMGNQKPVKSPD